MTQSEGLKRPTRVSPYWNPEIARDVWLYRQDEADAYIAQLEATIAELTRTADIDRVGREKAETTIAAQKEEIERLTACKSTYDLNLRTLQHNHEEDRRVWHNELLEAVSELSRYRNAKPLKVTGSESDKISG